MLKNTELDEENEEESDVLAVESGREDEIEIGTAIFVASRYLFV